MHGMRPFGALLSKEDALQRLLAAAAPVTRAEDVPLDQAAGRVAAQELRAPRDVPPYARSTMDGYAVADLGTGPWRIGGDVLAGSDAPRALATGEAARIATGAPVPPGARAVVRVEDTSEAGGAMTARLAPRDGQNIERAGADLARGDVLVREGAHLTPPLIGLLASAGHASVQVRAKPCVRVISTGDELLAPGDAPHPFRIFDSNSATLAALFGAHGCEVVRERALKDDAVDLARAMRADADVVIFTGGASAGAKDLLVDAMRKEGEVLFHGVRVKPGKPLLAGQVGRALIIGLPGNPTSALSNACLFVVPALRRMAGLPDAAPARTQARLASAVRGEADRYLFLPVKLEGDVATPTFKGSGALTSMAASDGWIGVPEGTELPAGGSVQVHAWW